MALIEEIMSLARKGRNATKDIEDINSLNTQSIARRAKSTTCQFPNIVPDTVPVEMGANIAKNMDRVYATFIQSVIAANPLIDITVDRGPLDYMKRLHQNIRLESVIDEKELFRPQTELETFKSFMESECPNLKVSDEMYESTMSQIYNGDYKLFLSPDGSFGVAFKESVITSDVMDSHMKQLREHLSEFNLNPFPVTEAPTRSEMLRGIVDNANAQTRDARMDFSQKTTKELNTPRMVDREAKRVNELQPYGLSVRLMAVNDKKEFVQYIDFIVGVKAVLHVVKSKDLVENIGNVLKNRNFTFNFIRWTTGEISFIKDLLLHIDDIKMDATYKTRGASAFFPTLKRLKEKKVQFSVSGINKLVPNATIVLTSFEVEDIKNTYGFDVRDIYFAKKVMKELFLLAFILVDEGTETIDILYEGSDAFETYTLETLEREIAMSSNKLGREIGRMISQ